MAYSSSSQFRCRISGSNANAGGYDATIPGAATDYTNQDAPQLSLTDVTTAGAGATQITSATGGFTAQMVGNAALIPSPNGANFTPKLYWIVGVIDTNNATLNESPTPSGAGSAGVCRIGGALLTLEPFSTAATADMGLAAGNTIKVVGDGSFAPIAVQFNWSAVPEIPFPNGQDTDEGYINVEAENGRPWVSLPYKLQQSATGNYWKWKGLKFTPTSDSLNDAIMVGAAQRFEDIVYDQRGVNKGLAANVAEIKHSDVVNSGGVSGGTPRFSIGLQGFGGRAIGVRFEDQIGEPLLFSQSGSYAKECSFARCRETMNLSSSSTQRQSGIEDCSFFNCSVDCIEIPTIVSVNWVYVRNNIFCDVSGVAVRLPSGVAHNLAKNVVDWNAFFLISGGSYANYSGGANDISLSGDPYSNAAGGDFSLNTTPGAGLDCIGSGFPVKIGTNDSNTNTLKNRGAWQGTPGSGGGASVVRLGAASYMNDQVKGETIRIMWETIGKSNVPIAPTVNGSVYSFKDGGTSKNTDGITTSYNHGGNTGVHLISIDTNNDAFDVESAYSVVAEGMTVDGVAGAGATLAGFTLRAQSIDDIYGQGLVTTKYVWSTDTTATDPTVGKIKANNTDYNLITAIYVSGTSDKGAAAFQFIEALRIGDLVIVSKRTDTSKFFDGIVSGAVTDHGGWYTIPISIQGIGDTITDGNNVDFSMFFVRVAMSPEDLNQIRYRLQMDSGVQQAPSASAPVQLPVLVGDASQSGLAKWVIEDTGQTAAVSGSVAQLSQGSGGLGPGGDVITITIDDGTSPLAQVLAWVTATQGGDPIVSGVTDSAGQVQFLLDAGITYYMWTRKDGYNPILGQPFVAQATVSFSL